MKSSNLACCCRKFGAAGLVASFFPCGGGCFRSCKAPVWALIDLSNGTTGSLGVASGATGVSSYAIGDILYASGTTALSKLADVATGNVLISGGITTAPAYGKVTLTGHVSGVLPEANGGTNQSTYAQGDLLYATATDTLAKLAKSTSSTRVLTNTGASNAPAWAQVTLTSGVTGTLPEANGGTGNASYAVGDLIQASATTTLAKLAAVATGNVLISGGVTTVSSWGKVTLTGHVSGVLPEANGGTNQSTYTTGDLLQASASNTLSKLAAVATGNVLLSGGTGTASAWGKVALATHVSGSLPVANGGLALTSATAGDILYASAADTWSKLAKDTNATRVLTNTGASNIPAWAQVALTTGVSGSLPVANGGLALTSATAGDILYASAADTWAKLAKDTNSTRVLTNTGASNVPAWAQVDLTTGVTGILPKANGGTGAIRHFLHFNARVVPPQANAAALGIVTGTSAPAESFQTWDFDSAAIEYIDYNCQIGALATGAGVTLRFKTVSSATSGDYIMVAAIRLLANDLDTTAFTYTTNSVSTTTTTSATAGTPTNVAIAFTSGTQMNSAVVGSYINIRIWRDATNASDTVNSNDIRVLEGSISLEET